jgi:uncharacterized Tic20 family protein
MDYNLMSSKDERTWALAAHLSSFLGYLVGGCGGIVGPLIVWLAKKDESSFVADQAKESLNFQISLLLYGVLLFLSCFPFLVGLAFVWFVGPALALAAIVLPIVGAVKANEGGVYRYPFTIRFIK